MSTATATRPRRDTGAYAARKPKRTVAGRAKKKAGRITWSTWAGWPFRFLLAFAGYGLLAVGALTGRIVVFLGGWGARGAWAGARWSGRHSVALGRRTTARVRVWTDDRARFGLVTTAVRITADGQTSHVPARLAGQRMAELLGEAPAPRYRTSGDRVREEEPPARRRWWAWWRADGAAPQVDNTTDPAPAGEVHGDEVKELEMAQDGKAWVNPDVLEDPAIDPDDWQEELPTFVDEVAEGGHEAYNALDSLTSYMAAAGVDETVLTLLSEACDAADTLAEKLAAVAKRVHEVYDDAAVPDFRKAG